jgi:hypothetical protein
VLAAAGLGINGVHGKHQQQLTNGLIPKPGSERFGT